MNDYIRIPRSALDLVKDDALWKVYGYLLSKTDEKGIATFTASEIKMRFDISRQRLRTMLGKLVENGIATNLQPTSNQQATNITFDFQLLTPAEQPTSNQQATNLQPTKASRKLKKFIPPTDEQVTAYVAEKGYHFNPAEFVPFYQTRGWKMKGGEPMKDWKAGCRYWETNWKQKHGERFYYEIQPIITSGNAASRKAQRDRGLSLATEIVARSENLLSLYNGGGADSDTRQD